MITGWESLEVIEATLADNRRRFAERIGAEQVTVRRPQTGVTVVIGVDGFLDAVRIEDRARRRRTAADVAAVVAAAVREAERAAADRRREIAESLEDG